jgi:Rieske Fe-S protein
MGAKLCRNEKPALGRRPPAEQLFKALRESGRASYKGHFAQSFMSPEPAGAPAEPPPSNPPATGRREFMKSAACVAVGGACVAAPVIAGVTVLLGPLRRPAPDGSWVQLTKLDLLPADSPPRLFQVFVERTDAWTRHQRSAVGSVFLERVGERDVRAFNASCPHLGCAVYWQDTERNYYCPCHKSSFTKDGVIVPPSPSARPLDTLLVEIRGENEVWVKFQDFKAGIAQKIPVA